MKNKYTLLFIPPEHRPTRQFQFSLDGKRILVSGLLTLGVVIISVFTYTVYLSHTLSIKNAELAAVDQLKQSNLDKDQEIQRLKQESVQMAQDLSSIQELELKLTSILKVDATTSLTGSQPSSQTPAPSSSQVSRGGVPQAAQLLTSDPQEISNQLNRLQQYYDMAVEYEDQINRTPSILPLKGEHEIASDFGYRRNPFGGWSNEFHNGVDFACNYGTPVYATAAGKVVFSGWDSVYGRKVNIDHGYGVETFYGHNSKLVVYVGDTVEKGQLIAYSGNSGRSTGSHLHYGAIVNGKSVDPLQFTQFTKEQ